MVRQNEQDERLREAARGGAEARGRDGGQDPAQKDGLLQEEKEAAAEKSFR